jgi:hypothetical protein
MRAQPYHQPELKTFVELEGLLEYFLIFCGLQSIAGFGFNKKKRVDVVVINLMMLRPNNCDQE